MTSILEGLVLDGLDLNSAGATTRPWVPTDITGCELWLAADNITGKNDGDAVSTWTDASTGGHNATQVTGSLQPLYKTGILNSKPALLFDGVDDQISSTLAADTSRTVFIVAKATADTGAANLFGFGSTSRARIKAGLGYEWVNDQAAALQALGGSVSTTAQVITMKVVSAASLVFYMNGTQTASFDPNDAVTTGTTLNLGAPAAGVWPGYIFEVVSYS